MKTTKTNLVLYGIFALAVFASIYSTIRAKKFQNKLQYLEEKKEKAKQDSILESSLLHIDSILIKGEYQSALNAYKEKFSTVVNDGEEKGSVKFRIEVAEQFMNLRKEIYEDIAVSDSVEELDTINMSPNATSLQFRAYDSLSFALEKTKVQLNRIKKQLKKRSYGEYLTFRNPKKHVLHYVGQVNNAKANGFGIALFDTGSRYEGEWKNNLRHGEGAFYWPDGERYQGEYVDDLRNGIGTYSWPNGEKYIGNWKNDQRDGEGVFYGKDGEVVTSGVWKKDKLVEEHKDKK
ncbi:hypothetical protein M0D21_12100 [Aquimarina sp. D1M17]|uniref:MORN repeat-containing protein n=1 Tax=Aquimarina acroporae TaxID=2937283 RepID=UPI0020BF54E0|nr:hypothetical protein [Aquimarina acroporae]MCK8522318.1 hypothetical protein [Aquimarina acroporae]